MYKLETKNYYNIKCPLINSYKDMGDDGFRPRIALASLVSELNLGGDPLSFVEEHFAAEIKKEWLDRNKKRLLEMKKTANALRKSEDLMIYADAMIFSHGIAAYSLSLMPDYSYDIFLLTNFALDFPISQNNIAIEKFGNEGYQVYLKYIPKTFTILPSVLANKAYSNEQKESFINDACMLFDYILQRATYSMLNVNNADVLKSIKNQILCYYKWLKNKKIYLPEELQKKIYDFSLMYS